MTKAEFVDQVAQRAGLNKQQAQKSVEAFLDTVQNALKSGGEVQFTGFGKFHVTDRAAREGVNPRDPGGRRIQIEARRSPKFTPGSALKAALKR